MKDGSKDYIYRRLLQTYLQQAITAGENIEFFIEGTRTRTGKPCTPKVIAGQLYNLASGFSCAGFSIRKIWKVGWLFF